MPEKNEGPTDGHDKPVKKRKWPHFTKRYGKAVRDAGVILVPRVLLTGMAELKLKPMTAIVVLQMLACWGKAGPHPFPSRRLMRKQIGCDKRTLDRAIKELVDLGLVAKLKRSSGKLRQTTNAYDLTTLIERLKPLGVRAVKEKRAHQRQRELKNWN